LGIIYGTIKLPPRNERYEIIENDIVKTADVCIIGSGAAGSVLSKELAEKGLKVVLLERGGYYEGKDMNQRDVDMIPLLWKNSGFQFDDSLKLAIAQGTCLGGSTIINDAVCFDPPEKVIDEWNSMGANFPYQEIQNHTNKVNTTLSVSEATDEELNRNNQMLRNGAKKIGLKHHHKNQRNCINCMQCGYCHLGCHYETKQDMLHTYLHKALNDPNSDLSIYCNCYIDTLEKNENGIIQGVEGTFRDSGGNDSFRIRVNAKIVIISAGTIASSKILLQNGIAQKTSGTGLCFHPSPTVVAEFDKEIKGNEGVPMAYTVHDFGVTRSDNETWDSYEFSGREFLIESIFLPILQFSTAIPVALNDHLQIMRRLNNLTMAGIVVRDRNNGKVSLTPTGRASVQYTLGDEELESMIMGIKLLAKMWFELGAKRIITSMTTMSIINSEDEIPQLVDEIRKNRQYLYLGSAHPQSGNKIGLDKETSVVDSNCKVHGFQNLFVCDASVFPTAVGVNPQITVMTIASIIAERISNNWSQFNSIPISESLGNTCSLSQPFYCLQKNLSEMFDSLDNNGKALDLINDEDEKANDNNWSFDPQNLTIQNNTYWKGLFPRNGNIPNTLTAFLGGFWKRFTEDSSGENSSKVKGITHPFELGVFAKNKAFDKVIDGFGKVIILDYSEPGYDQFHDVLKFVDKNMILGKAFFRDPQKGQEMLTFSMARKYPLEFMTEEDHSMLYSKMSKPDSFDSIVGIWEGQLVSDSIMTPPVFVFRYYFDSENKLQNDYLFNGILSGTAKVNEEDDHYEMQDVTQIFHDELRQVNKDLLIGKYCTEPSEITRWIPNGLSFLNVDRESNKVCLPYILKRIGEEEAYRGYRP